MSWTEEKVNKLKELWGKGSTASQIAEIIGGVSRNAVIGKAHRLNLSTKIKAKTTFQSTKINLSKNDSQIKFKGKRSKFKSLLLDKNFEPAKNLNLEEISSYNSLSTKQQSLLKSSIVFEFGSQHKKRIEDWFKKNLNAKKIIAHTRSYEVALSMVEAELGVVVLPALTAMIGFGKSYDVNLYQTDLLNRKLVSLTPKQNENLEPVKSFISCLVKAGKTLNLPSVKPMPFILKNLS